MLKKTIKKILIGFIILTTAVKLCLMGSGFYSVIDFARYDHSIQALKYFSKLEIRSGVNAIFTTQARPGDAVTRIISCIVQFATKYFFKLHYFEPANSYPVFIINFIVYCLILVVHFKFSKLLLKDGFLALVSVILLGSMTSSFLYIRDVLPYDQSLLILYFLIYLTTVYILEDRLTYKKSFILGFSAFFGYLVYPGYFPLFVICVFLIFFSNLSKDNFIKKTFYSGYFALGSIICLIVTEGIGRVGYRSYIDDAFKAGKRSITQFSFEESYTFIFKYLFEVEGIAGIILIIGLVLFYFTIIQKLINKSLTKPPIVIILGIGTTVVFLAYTSMGYFFHSAALYGRLLHMYFPFICIFCLFSINDLIKLIKNNEIILFVLCLIFIINFGVNFIQFKSLAYPKDVGWELIKKYDPSKIEVVCEDEDARPEMITEFANSPQAEKLMEGATITPTNVNSYPPCDIIVTNCCLYYPLKDITRYHPFDPGDKYKLLEEKNYYLNFKAYQFEGYEIESRENVRKMNFKIKIYSLKTPSS